MVQVVHHLPVTRDGFVDEAVWQQWLLNCYGQEACHVVETALDFVKACDDQALLSQGICMAVVLSELHADPLAIAAALVYPFYQYKQCDDEQLKTRFDTALVSLLQGTRQMMAVKSLQAGQSKKLDGAKVKGLRNMMLAMVRDVRVVLIKLAESVCAMRNYKSLPDAERRQWAQDIMQIYAPLANRLGIGQIKWELEDQAFRWLYPEDYNQIKARLDSKRLDREVYIADVITAVEGRLKQNSISGEVAGRVKHIYSIWRKMQKKHLDFEGLFDIRAIRVLTQDVSSCYRALSLIHDLWQPLPNEFDDYIAAPKPNGYRSIHTVVAGPQGKTIEVQIRTYAMHEENEMGVAAHWRYKEGGGQDTSLASRINWLRSLLDWQSQLSEEETFAVLQHQAIDERVYVFAKDGAVFELPKGATPLDFAYQVHTQLGHRCRGAKVDNKIVPLTYQLNTGDSVEILTNSQPRPSRDWLHSDSGYLVTSRARSKVSSWFRQQDKSTLLHAGREALQKAMRKEKFTGVDYEQIAIALNLKRADDLFAAVGCGDLKLPTVVKTAKRLFSDVSVPEQPEIKPLPVAKPHSAAKSTALVVGGVDNLLVTMAKCCKPIVGDQVVGYVSQGRGVTVHRQGCKQFKRMQERAPNRTITVQWGEKVQRHFVVDLQMTAEPQAGVLKDIIAMLGAEKVSILGLNARHHTRRQVDVVSLTVEVQDSEQLDTVRRALRQISGIIDVVRQ